MRYLLALLLLCCLPASAQTLIGEPVPIQGTRGFEEFDKPGLITATNISGGVCLQSGRCFAASDETRFVQEFRRGSTGIRVGGRLYLAKTHKWAETRDFDLEALAHSGNTLIAVGSHSMARKKCVIKPNNWSVFIGEPDAGAIGSRTPLTPQRISLQPLLEAFTVLEPFLNRPLQRNGLNIEGAAVLGHTLYFGLRAPYLQEVSNRALILSVDIDELRNGTFASAKLHRVDLKTPLGVGIRGMESYQGGIILLSGNAGASGKKAIGACATDSPNRGHPFRLHYWQPNTDTADLLGEITLPKQKWKAEGVLLDPEQPVQGGKLALILFFDKPKNGAPHRYMVTIGE